MRKVLHFALILALFVGYQTNLKHSITHIGHKQSDCRICVASKDAQQASHATHFVWVDENILKNQHLTQRILLKQPIAQKHKPIVKRLDFEGLKRFVVALIPLGYLSTAPPSFS